MTKRDCGQCPFVADFCGKAVCRMYQPKRYLKHIPKCSNAGLWTADGKKAVKRAI